MRNETTINTLNALKIFGMAKRLPERLGDPHQAELDHGEFVGLLVEDEKTHREDQRLKRILKNAKLRFPKRLPGGRELPTPPGFNQDYDAGAGHYALDRGSSQRAVQRAHRHRQELAGLRRGELRGPRGLYSRLPARPAVI